MKYLLIILIAIIPSLGFAKDKLSQSELASAKSQLKYAVNAFEYASIGILGDGNKYAVISYSTNEDAAREKEQEDQQASINRFALFRFENGGIVLTAATKPLTSYGPRDGVDCDIKGNLINITHRNSSTLWSESNETWKFNIAGNKLPLIGYDTIYSEAVGDEKNPKFSESATSINFITNKVKHWRKTGTEIQQWNNSATWNKPYNIIKPDKNKEYSFDFKDHDDFMLEAFDEGLFSNWLRKDRKLYGHVNESYTYEPFK